MGGQNPPPLYISISDENIIPQFDGNISIDELSIEESQKIPVVIFERPSYQIKEPRVPVIRKIITTSKKVLVANQLPVVVNLNPRSIYNKQQEYRTMIEQLEVDCCFISESWDRDNQSLEQTIAMDGYQIVKNIKQRDGQGGKPALMINKSK